MSPARRFKLHPVLWCLLIFIVTHVLIIVVAARIDPFLEEEDIYVPGQPGEEVVWWPGEVTLPSGETIDVPPQSSLGPILIYFLAVVAVVGITLALIPLRMLKTVIRVMFAFLFGWGAFILAALYLPLWPSIAIAALFGAVWFLIPLVWLHDLALVIALTSLGAIFGYFISPWTAMALILALAVYDFLAVRFGFMVWMANRMSQLEALPALIVPRRSNEWGINLRKQSGGSLITEQPVEREYSVLGGGDIAFPGLLTASVYFSQGLAPADIIAACGLAGLVGAYVIQATFLKGRPMPALPPIAAATLVGLLLI